MNKLVIIIITILIVFILSSFSIYLVHLRQCGVARKINDAAENVMEEWSTADGEVRNVDARGKTITLIVGDQPLTFFLDEGTAVTRSGEVIESSAIKVGARATVRYIQRSGNKKAGSIAVYPPAAVQVF